MGYLTDIITDTDLGKFDIREALKDSKVDLSETYQPQPILLSHGQDYAGNPLCVFGQGDYSVISGVGNSKKTFFKTALIASYIGGQANFGWFKSHMQDKKMVVEFDTEQSDSRTQIVFRRVEQMVGSRYPNYICFKLRKYSPAERMMIIEEVIEMYGDKIGLISIDGYADLIDDTNDNVQSAQLAQSVMTWTDKYKFHVTGILHENPDGRKMRGHLGSEMSRKASTIFSVIADPDKDNVSKVYHTKSRDEKIQPFEFEILNGLPYVI